MRPDTGEQLTAKIPADVEQPDKLIYGLTLRQLAVLAVTALAAFWLYLAAASLLPLPAVLAAVIPLVSLGVVVALARRDGMSLDRFAVAALAHVRTPHRQVDAPEGVAPPPAWCRMRGRMPAPLRPPVRAVREDGVLELADGGIAVLVEAGTVPFALRTAAEQAELVAVFGRWLNSLDTPVQILAQTRPVELSGLADHYAAAAGKLPDPALAGAARDHATFLTELGAERDLLTRRVLLVLRTGTGPGRSSRPGFPWPPAMRRQGDRDMSAQVLMQAAGEAARTLTTLGMTARVLDAMTCTDVLIESLSPGQVRPLGLARPDDVITSGESTE